MSKNMIKRKALAATAGSALLLSMISAAPASAVDAILMEVDAGTSYVGVISTDGSTNFFNLRTTTNSSSSATLKYRIQNPSGAEVHVEGGNNGSAGTISAFSADDDQVYKTGTTTADTTVTATVGTTFADFVVDPSKLAADESGSASADNILSLSIDAATSTVTLTITAWLDTVSAAAQRLDSVETQAASVEVTFYKAADLTWTFTTNPVSGDASVTAAATVTPNVNGNYLSAAVTALHSRPGATAEVQESLTWSNVTETWTGSGIALDGTVNWTGMYTNSTLTGGGSNDTVVTFTTSRAGFITTGDVVRVDSSVATLDVDRGTVTAITGSVFSIADTDRDAGAAGVAVAAAADTGYVTVLERKLTNSIASLTHATYTSAVAHGLSAGDTVIVDSSRDGTLDRATAVTVTEVPSVTTFKVALAVTATAVVATGADTGVVKYVSAFVVAPGAFEAQGQVGGVDAGTKAEAGTITTASASTAISTTASASVQNAIDTNADGTYDTILVKAGTLSVDVVATVLDSTGVALGAGRSVRVSTLTETGTVQVNARTSAGEILTTNASGQVTLSVSSVSGASSEAVTVVVTPEGVSSAAATFTLDWTAQSYGLYDLNATSTSALANANGTDLTLSILKGSSYTLSLSVLDQWFQAGSSDVYRVKATGSGVASGFVGFVNGVANVTISDSGLGTSYSSDIDLQKLTGGVWADVNTYPTTVVTNMKTGKLLVAADGSSLYSAETADLSDVVSLKALLELDKRKENGVTPAYVNNLVVTGQVVSSTSLVGLEGAAVTITGASNILFEDGAVAKRGSLTILSESDGDFSFNVYSTSAQTATVLTITALGVSTTVKVTFTGQTAGEGTVLTISTPSSVQPASSFQVTVNLSDALGNGVSTGTDGSISITRTGPGIAFGTLPVNTDASGNASFSVLLGSNDSGIITITASYDQNDDGDLLDAKDLTVSKTLTVGASAASAEKVNVGSFKGYVALYAKGYKGKKMSAIVAGKWIVVASLASDFERVVRYTGAGYDIVTTIYIDGVAVQSFNVTTK